MPEPTKHGLGAELHDQRGVGRRGDAAGAEQRHRQLARLGDLLHQRRAAPAAAWPSRYSSAESAWVILRMSPRIERRWRTASTMLPVPASPLERIMAGALGDAAQRLAQVGGPAHERHGEGPLVDVVGLVGRGEHLALVDVVDAEGLEDLGLGEVADAGLGHDRDGDRGLDALDHLGVAHAGHAAVAADVGRHPLERHDRHGPGVLGDLGLVGCDHVHDHAAPEHLGQAPLDQVGAGATGGFRGCHASSLRRRSSGTRPHFGPLRG